MASTPGSADWVRRFHPSPEPATRLVCFPHAGGSASYFFPVSRVLPRSIEVLCLQYPGRQDRRTEPCLDKVQAFAEHAAAALTPWSDVPLVFFGHSLGASIAYETARLLRSAGTDVAGLFASGRRGPGTFRDERNHLASDEDLVRELQSLSGTEGSLLGDREVLRMILPAMRADYRAAETYRSEPGAPLDCPVFAMIGDADAKVTVDEAREWGEHTNGPFELRVFPGGHFYLNNHQEAVIKAISDHALPIAARP